MSQTSQRFWEAPVHRQAAPEPSEFLGRSCWAKRSVQREVFFRVRTKVWFPLPFPKSVAEHFWTPFGIHNWHCTRFKTPSGASLCIPEFLLLCALAAVQALCHTGELRLPSDFWSKRPFPPGRRSNGVAGGAFIFYIYIYSDLEQKVGLATGC